MDRLIQDERNILIQSKKTVDWLIEKTRVKTFNPKTFEGYQRKIDEKHARKIVDYIYNNVFYFPTAIICSSESGDDEGLSIVDGQHRVQAFRIVKKENPEFYQKIKDYEIPVIILKNPDLATEIDTFITINKTSKKVDTSLAYVLKNKINKDNTDDITNKARREYLSVEVARKLNTDKKYNIWNDKILYEGSIRNRYEYITLNGFVRSMRALLGALDKRGIISCAWDSTITDDELNEKIETISDLVELIWDLVYKKWPDLKTDNLEDSRIVQGTIGFTTINRYLVNRINDFKGNDLEDFKCFVKEAILNDIKVSGEKWKKGNIYSKFTSESGYKAIVDDLLGNGIG